LFDEDYNVSIANTQRIFCFDIERRGFMKKLKVVTSYAQVVGFILSYSMEEFYLDQYAYNAYGEYTRFCLYAWNDPNDEEDVFNQPDLASRIKRLHYYFPKAEYISEEVIEHLNFEKEDIKTALKDVVEF